MSGRRLVSFAGLDAAHKAAVRHVYESSFPLALRAPWDEVEAGRPDEQLLVLVDGETPGAPPVGLVLVRHLGDTSMSFLRYFVIDAERRGSGHGSALWSTLVDHLRQARRSMLLLDVEDPDGRLADSAERRDDLRRIEFYRRHGVHLLAVREYAPPDHGQEGEQARLLLMGASLTHVGGDIDKLGPAPAVTALRDAVTAVYRHRYGLDPGHPVVRTTLRASGLSP